MNNRKLPQGAAANRPQQQPQRLSPGVYRMPNGSLGNGRMPQQRQQQPQAVQRPAPGYMPQQPMPQQFNQNFQMPQGYPQMPQQPNPWMGQGGYGAGNFMQQQMPQQGGGYGAQGQADANQGYWRKTAQPAQPMGILGGFPDQYK